MQEIKHLEKFNVNLYHKLFKLNIMEDDFMSELKKFKEKHGAIFENKFYQELKEEADDLVMYINIECERRNECFRFTKTPSEHQYSALYGKMNGENGCNYFYEPKHK